MGAIRTHSQIPPRLYQDSCDMLMKLWAVVKFLRITLIVDSFLNVWVFVGTLSESVIFPPFLSSPFEEAFVIRSKFTWNLDLFVI